MVVLRYGSIARCLLRMPGWTDFPSSAMRVSREPKDERGLLHRLADARNLWASVST
jgi:hypothetical protein